MDLPTLIRLSPAHVCATEIGRTAAVHHAYNVWCDEVVGRFGSLSSAIEHEVFGAPARVAGPDNERLVLQGRAPPNAWRLTPNKFPYDLAPGLRHYVLWATEPPGSLGEVAAMLAKEAPNMVHWFINVPKNQSVPELFHAHVITAI